MATSVANVSLQDTFDTWRIRTNQLIAISDQAYAMASIAANSGANSVNTAMIFSNDSSNITLSAAYAYVNNLSNTVTAEFTYSYGLIANTSANLRAYANTTANNANAYARNYANTNFLTIANSLVIFRHANAAFDRANSKIASVTGTAGRIVTTGSTNTAITLDFATAGPGAASYGGSGISTIGVDAYGRVTSVATASYQPLLGFTPVQQGGGTGQGTNKLYIGWTASSKLAVQVDATNFGTTWPIDISGQSNYSLSSGLSTSTLQVTWPYLYTTTQYNAQGSQGVAGNTMLTSVGGLGGIMVQGPGGANSAFMCFHRPGVYASYFGIDSTDNQFAVGGWSAGAALASMKVRSLGVGVPASGVANNITIGNSGVSTGGTIGVNYSGTGGTYVFGTTGDNATSTTTNLKITSWYGIGFGPSISGQTVPQWENAMWLNARTGDLSCRANITAYASDERLKKNFVVIENALSKIMQISGYTFDWQTEKCKSLGFAPYRSHEHGLKAQEVEQVLSDAVDIAPFDSDSDKDGNKISRTGENYLTVKYEKLVPLLIEAIKELKAEVDELKKGR